MLMIRLLKRGLILLLVLCVSVLLFVTYISSGNLPKESYYEVIDYKDVEAISDSSLEVMTYNIGYLSGMTNNQSVRREKSQFDVHLSKAKDLIQKYKPAIIGLQEIDFASSRSFDVDQLESIALAGQYRVGYKSINWDKKYVPFPYWPPSNHFGKILSGQAILSTYPIVGDSTVILKPNLKTPAYYRAFYLDRLMQVATIHFQGVQVKVINVHLEAFDRETRLEQIAQVKDEFSKYAATQPVILMGDFNSEIPNTSKEKDAIELLMSAKWIASAISFDKEFENRTFPSEYPQRMIDYIFYNENFLNCNKTRVLNDAGQVSDHLPLVAGFELIGNAKEDNEDSN